MYAFCNLLIDVSVGMLVKKTYILGPGECICRGEFREKDKTNNKYIFNETEVIRI